MNTFDTETENNSSTGTGVHYWTFKETQSSFACIHTDLCEHTRKKRNGYTKDNLRFFVITRQSTNTINQVQKPRINPLQIQKPRINPLQTFILKPTPISMQRRSLLKMRRELLDCLDVLTHKVLDIKQSII